MEITGTRSYIKVGMDGRTVKIRGEMLVGGFVAYMDTIIHWEPPYEHIMIDEKDKTEIVRRVIQETKDSDFKIEFE